METRISEKTRKLAKKKGCDLKYCTCGGFPECICTRHDIPQSWLQKWLRDKCNISVEVNYMLFGVQRCNGWYYRMTILPTKDTIAAHLGMEYYGKDLFSGFDTYEEALEAGFQNLLSLKSIKFPKDLLSKELPENQSKIRKNKKN